MHDVAAARCADGCVSREPVHRAAATVAARVFREEWLSQAPPHRGREGRPGQPHDVVNACGRRQEVARGIGAVAVVAPDPVVAFGRIGGRVQGRDDGALQCLVELARQLLLHALAVFARPGEFSDLLRKFWVVPGHGRVRPRGPAVEQRVQVRRRDAGFGWDDEPTIGSRGGACSCEGEGRCRRHAAHSHPAQLDGQLQFLEERASGCDRADHVVEHLKGRGVDQMEGGAARVADAAGVEVAQLLRPAPLEQREGLLGVADLADELDLACLRLALGGDEIESCLRGGPAGRAEELEVCRALDRPATHVAEHGEDVGRGVWVDDHLCLGHVERQADSPCRGDVAVEEGPGRLRVRPEAHIVEERAFEEDPLRDAWDGLVGLCIRSRACDHSGEREEERPEGVSLLGAGGAVDADVAEKESCGVGVCRSGVGKKRGRKLGDFGEDGVAGDGVERILAVQEQDDVAWPHCCRCCACCVLERLGAVRNADPHLTVLLQVRFRLAHAVACGEELAGDAAEDVTGGDRPQPAPRLLEADEAGAKEVG